MADSRLTYALVGALTASVAAGATAGGLIIRRQRRRGRAHERQDFDDVAADRTRTIQSEDGVALYIEEVGPPDAPLSVVFVHGFALSLRSFHFQRAALRDRFGTDLRLVFYDQRSHGRSGPSVPGSATIEELGRDLYVVLDAVVPDGPVVLVGHSMGGMSVLALTERHPELFAAAALPAGSPPLAGVRRRAARRRPATARITGVALLATSAGGLADVRFGLPTLLNRLRGPLAPVLLRGARRQAGLVEHGRRIGADLAWIITRRFSFGDRAVNPEVVDFLHDIIAGTRIETIADFYPTLMTYDANAALPTLRHTDVLVVGGEFDLLTPLSHSRLLADALPEAELVVGSGAGHALILERPDLVDEALVALVTRRLDAARTRRR